MKITVWSDFACPFCYMGFTVLERVAAESEGPRPEIEFRAYELNPDAPAVPVESMKQHFMSDHGITEAEAETQMARITKMASRLGLDYNLEGVKVCSTFDAHRLIKYAQAEAAPEAVAALEAALYKANFIDNLLLSDREVLADAAATAGLDREAVAGMLASGRYADAVRADEKEAEGLDLEYIPYLRFGDGHVLQGVLSPGAVRKVLAADAAE